MFVFRKIWRALFCCYLRFEIYPFALSPTNSPFILNSESHVKYICGTPPCCMLIHLLDRAILPMVFYNSTIVFITFGQKVAPGIF